MNRYEQGLFMTHFKEGRRSRAFSFNSIADDVLNVQKLVNQKLQRISK